MWLTGRNLSEIASQNRLKTKFQTRHPPPRTPVITRWGTWLDVTVCYADDFDIFTSLVNEFDRDDYSATAVLE
jgi:hypothetical protein